MTQNPKKLIFVGYCDNTKGYRLFDSKTRKVVVSRDVNFFENKVSENPQSIENIGSVNIETIEVPYSSEDIIDKVKDDYDVIVVDNVDEVNVLDSDDEEDNIVHSDDNVLNIVDDANEEQVVRRSARIRQQANFPDAVSYSAMVNNIYDPETVREAMSGEQRKEWQEAMLSEYDSLIKNNTWTLMNLPNNRKLVNSKWVFKTKTTADGQVLRYKARLVAKGCSQKYGLDYFETFSPVVRYTSIRYLMALAARFNLDIDQMDATTAFLQGEIDEEIYTKQPECLTAIIILTEPAISIKK